MSTVKAVECDRPAVEGAAMTTEDSSGSNSSRPPETRDGSVDPEGPRSRLLIHDGREPRTLIRKFKFIHRTYSRLGEVIHNERAEELAGLSFRPS